MTADLPPGVTVAAPMHDRYDEVLTSDALAFLALLHRGFDQRRRDLLDLREQRDPDSQRAGRSTSCPTRCTSATTRRGGWPSPPQDSSTAGSRSRDRPTGR